MQRSTDLLEFEECDIPCEKIRRRSDITNVASPHFHIFPLLVFESITMLIEHNGHAVVIAQEKLGMTAATL